MYTEFHTYRTTSDLLFNHVLTRVILNHFSGHMILAVKVVKEHEPKKGRRFVICKICFKTTIFMAYQSQ